MKFPKQVSYRAALLGLAALGVQVGCSNPGLSIPDGQQTGKTTVSRPESSGDAVGELNPELAITVAAKSTLRDLSAWIVGAHEKSTLKLEAEVSDTYILPLAAKGTYDIILTAQKALDESNVNFRPVGIRVSGIQAFSSKTIILRDIELLPLISLKGKVLLQGKTSFEGSEVTVPGTELKVTTAADGSFELKNIPVGQHDLQARAPGFVDGYLEKRSFTGTSDLPSVTLPPNSPALPLGLSYLGAPLPAGGPQKVVVQLIRPVGKNSFRWGYSSDLSQAEWIPYQSSLELELPAGQRDIFLQYALDRQQLSGVYSLKIPSAK